MPCLPLQFRHDSYAVLRGWRRAQADLERAKSLGYTWTRGKDRRTPKQKPFAIRYDSNKVLVGRGKTGEQVL